MRHRWIAAAAVAAMLVGTAWAVDTGTVQGSVRDQEGPASGLKVTIESAGDSRYGAEAITDGAGAFAFAGVPIGEVEVKVYDGQDRLKVKGKGLLEHAGESITLLLQVEP